WYLTAGIKNSRFPIKYAIIPPIYDIEAKAKRNNHGDAVFEAQAINISGGTNPNTVSEIRKTVNITEVE
ncbi:MAG: hypothetical protein HC905_12995, partial [Bacteroidales bacterium]|nr:hypothetical protein [Bacteroidales bacterium]